LDCSACFYPNDDEACFCVRCAAPLGLSPDRLPQAPAPISPDMLGAGQPADFVPVRGAVLGGKYRLARHLGGGGFGTVYEAVQEGLGLKVAVKLLKSATLWDPRVRERFLAEARIVAQLRCPHVVVLHDYDVTDEGTPYLVMELLNGRDLGMLLCEGVFSARRALHVAAQVCQALGEAHAAGIVHRDVKPENVVLITRGSERDFVKVVDFGVAKLCSGAETRTSAVLGTPAYIAPEMLANDPIDGRTDLYAVGIMLWEMIVGQLPFPGTNQAVMLNSHLNAPRRWPRAIDPALRLADPLEDLLVQLVARDPADRPRTAYELRARLLELMPLASDVPLPVPAPTGGPPWDPPANK
jgi:serine/threonine-protein kinase